MAYRAGGLSAKVMASILSSPIVPDRPETPLPREDSFSTELAAMQLLHEISTQFVQGGNTTALYRQMVNAALTITEAELGNIQILDPVSGNLRMAACVSRGMPLPECCRHVDKVGAACGITLKKIERLIVDDISADPDLADMPSRPALEASGVRALQTMPLLTRSGRLVGILSVHGRRPRRPTESELRLLDMLARQIADIIECSEANSALHNSLKRHRSLFENMLDACCHGRVIFENDIPLDFECLAVNPAFEKVTGLSNATGRRISELVPRIRTENPELFLICGEVAQTGRPARFETYIAAFGIWLSVVAYRPARGEFVAVFDDITEKKRLELELQKRRNAAEELLKQQVAAHTAAAIAHELNQPLVAISAYSEVALRLLKGGSPQPEKLARALEGSFTQAQRAGRTLHELLDFLHNGETESGVLDLNEAVKEAVALVEGDAFFRPTLELEPGLPPVRGNRVQIQKILDNLLRNGIEAMTEAGISPAVAIRTTVVDGMARVSVHDDGPGIDAATLPRLFDPFFTTKANGLGLGLAISRTLVQAHGGRLWPEREGGPGACFHFTLPFAS